MVEDVAQAELAPSCQNVLHSTAFTSSFSLRTRTEMPCPSNNLSLGARGISFESAACAITTLVTISTPNRKCRRGDALFLNLLDGHTLYMDTTSRLRPTACDTWGDTFVVAIASCCRPQSNRDKINWTLISAVLGTKAHVGPGLSRLPRVEHGWSR